MPPDWLNQHFARICLLVAIYGDLETLNLFLSCYKENTANIYSNGRQMMAMYVGKKI